MISPLAYIHPEAKIGNNCEIGPFCYIDRNVVIGDNNTLMNSVTVLYGSRIGNGNTFFPGAVIGAIPQDLKFVGEESTAEIGDSFLASKRHHQSRYGRKGTHRCRFGKSADGRRTRGSRRHCGQPMHYR